MIPVILLLFILSFILSLTNCTTPIKVYHPLNHVQILERICDVLNKDLKITSNNTINSQVIAVFLELTHEAGQGTIVDQSRITIRDHSVVLCNRVHPSYHILSRNIGSAYTAHSDLAI